MVFTEPWRFSSIKEDYIQQGNYMTFNVTEMKWHCYLIWTRNCLGGSNIPLVNILKNICLQILLQMKIASK